MSFGLMFIAVNLLYLLFSVIVGVIVLLILEKNKKWTLTKRLSISTGVFIFVFILPFYDLLIQKGIKTYYETFRMNNTIYSYPERDKDGNIESLGIDKNVNHEVSGYLSEIKDYKKLKNRYAIKTFLECYMSDSFYIDNNGGLRYNYYEDMGYTRVYFDTTNIKYEKIVGKKDFKARYQILGKVSKHLFYTKTIVYFWDKKKNILLSKGIKINFPIADKNVFRNKYLLFNGSNGVGPGIRPIMNYGKFYRQLVYNR